MRVFVYEYMTAAGTGRDPVSPAHAMYCEGRAMRDALSDDFRLVPGVTVATGDDLIPNDSEDDLEHSVWRIAEECDWSLVIAPETDRQLDQDCWAVRYSASRLLGSSVDAVRLTSDKLALAEHWRAHGVRTPATTARGPTACEAFPVVWKPRDGAGSTDTFLLRDRFAVASALANLNPARPMILQDFVPGRAASVAFLCGPREYVPLLPTFQTLSDDNRFHYLGGELPIPDDLAERAVTLGRAAVECVPGLLGYVGVDVVLGTAPDGTRDYAIEINPRLTTSYIGLRALADFNLAEAMLRVVRGEAVGALKWKPGRVRFAADGAVTHL